MATVFFRATLVFGGAFLPSLYAAAEVSASSEGEPWYLIALWVLAALTGVLFLASGIIYLVLQINQFRHAIEILDEWHCNYWPSDGEKQLGVTLYVKDATDAEEYEASCSVRFGDLKVDLTDRIQLGGTYMSGSHGLASGKKPAMMCEFHKFNFQLEERPTEATVHVRIRTKQWWLGAAEERTRTIPVNIIRG